MIEFLKTHFKSIRTWEVVHFCSLLLLIGLPVCAHFHVEALYTPFATSISSLVLYIAGRSAVEAINKKT